MKGFCDDSELLKHEIAYVLGQTQNKKAVIPLEKVLKNESEQVIVRHEVRRSYLSVFNVFNLFLGSRSARCSE